VALAEAEEVLLVEAVILVMVHLHLQTLEAVVVEQEEVPV
jgi:hypothetical protein